MSIVERLRDIVKRAMMSEEKLQEQGLSRPLLTPFSEDSEAVAIAAGQLYEALAVAEGARKTLEWYANPANYEQIDLPTNVGQDRGLMARVTLARIME